MLDVGRHIDSVHSDDVGETILGVIKSVERNKIRMIVGVADGNLIISNANEVERFGLVAYKKWRVIGIGVYWGGSSTANEDPIIDFGYSGDDDAFAKMTSAITGGEKFTATDHQKYDPLNLLPPEVIAEASATMVVTWTKGVDFGVWKKGIKDLWCREAAVAGMSSGSVKPYMLVEVDTGGKW